MIAEIVFAALMVFFIALLGSRLLIRMQLLWYERLLFSFGIGTVAAALAVFYLGLLGLLHRQIFLAAALLLLLLSVGEIKKLRKLRLPKLNFDLNAFFYLIAAFLIAANFVMALAPVFTIDALNYHLPIAKYYAQNNAVLEMPNHVYSRLPHGLSMLFAVPEVFGMDERVAVLISSSLSAGAVLAAMALTHRFFSRKAAGLAGVIFATVPNYIEFASQPLADLPVAFFALLAFYAFLSVAGKKQAIAWVVLFSVFAGSIAFFRITALFMPLEFGIVFAAAYRRSLPLVLLAGVVMLAVAAPWFVWVFSATGDPIYPFMADLTKDPAAKNLKDYSAGLVMEGSGLGAFNAEGFMRFLGMPFKVTFAPTTNDNILGISPLLLAFMPLYLFRIPRRTYSAAAAAVFLMSLFVWYFTNPGLRYLLPAIALLVPPTAYAAYWVMQNSRFRLVIFAAVILAMLFSGPIWLGIAAKRIPGAFGLISEQDYLAGRPDSNPIQAVNYANANLPDEARVMLYQETRSYHLQRDYFLADTYLQQTLDFDKFSDASQLRAELELLGITHILVGRTSAANDVFGNIRHREILIDDLIQTYTEVLYEDDRHRLLKLI